MTLQVPAQEGKQLHLVGQVRAPVNDRGAAVSEFMTSKGELQPVQTLLELQPGVPYQGIWATDKVGDFLFMSYMDDIPSTVRVFDWRRGKLYPPTVFNPEHKQLPPSFAVIAVMLMARCVPIGP